MSRRPVAVAVVGQRTRAIAELIVASACISDQIRWLGVVALGAPMADVDVLVVSSSGNAEHDEKVLRQLASVNPAGSVSMALAGSDFSTSLVRAARRRGVRAFIDPAWPPEAMAEALLVTADGGSVEHARNGASGKDWVGRDAGLSERESQVLLLCAQGLTNREIAETLYINVETVKSHLKNVYSGLGLHNRAQAATYVHRARSSGRMVPLDWSSDGNHRDDSTATPAASDPPSESVSADSLALHLGLDEDTIGERLALLGLTAERRARLGRFSAGVDASASTYAERLTARWLEFEQTSPLLHDESVLRRLVDHQRRYLLELFTSPFDLRHCEAMVRIGAMHHRLRLPPQLYLASYVHLIGDHLDVVFDGASDADALEDIVTLISSVLFDASVVLDAYEVCVEREIIRRTSTPIASTVVDSAPTVVEESRVAPARRRSLARVALARDDADLRRRFVGLTSDHDTTLRSIAPVVAEAIPAILERFYAMVASIGSVVDLVTPDAAPHLMEQVAVFWDETFTTGFDRGRAATRMRVGVIHERIGLTPQFYLAGLAHQISGILRALPRPGADLRRDVDALVRAVFFDVTFVIDAYMEARSATLIQTGRFASQVVAGLANGVAIIDGRGRIEHANEQLLAIVGVAAGLLHRMPIESALPFDGIGDLLSATRSSPSGRVTALYTAWGRTLRVTGVRMQRSNNGGEGFVAVVVDDISEVIRASAELDHEERRFDHVLSAVDALAWEMDGDSLTVLAASRAAMSLTGVRETDLLGRATLVELVHPDERERFVRLCRELEEDDQVHLDHRIRRSDGEIRWVRTSMVATVEPSGTRTVSGVTVDVTELHRSHDRELADFAGLADTAVQSLHAELGALRSELDALSADGVPGPGPDVVTLRRTADRVERLLTDLSEAARSKMR